MVARIVGQDSIAAYLVEQTALGVSAAPPTTGATAFRILEFTATPETNRIPIDDTKGGDSYIDQVSLRGMTNWSMRTRVRPPAVGQAAQVGPMIEAWMAKAGASVSPQDYTYSRGTPANLRSRLFTLYVLRGNGAYEFCEGLVCKDFGLNGPNDSLAEMTFGGPARVSGVFTPFTISAAGAAADSFSIPVASAGDLQPGAWIQIAGTGNVPVRVTEIGTRDSTAKTVTVTISTNQTWAADAAVTSPVPTPAFAQDNQPLYMTQGSIAIKDKANTAAAVASASIGWMSYALTGTNSVMLVTDEDHEILATDVKTEGFATVNTTAEFKSRHDNLHLLHAARNNTPLNMSKTIGKSSSRKLTIATGDWRPNNGGVTIPESEEGSFSLDGQCFGNASEFSLAFS